MRTSAIGSLPGTDLGAGVRLALEAVSVPWLPEFPARGPWAGMVGRALGLLDGLGAELSAGEWRLAAVPGVDQRRARAALRDDLDVLEENAQGLTGPLKVAVTGPWTLAASVFRPLGGRVLADRGARRDVAQSIAAGVRDLVADVERRLPGVEVLVQVDEPALPAVLAGAVPTEGGYFRHRAVDRPEAVELLRELGGHVLHCCAPGLDVGLVLGPHGAGFTGVALDQDLLSRAAWDALAPLVEDGKELWLGAAPTASGVPLSADALTRRVLGALRPLELGPVVLDRVVLTPACGLAGWTPAAVSAVLRALRTTAERMDEELSR
ncbi:methionine synthase vitamin-B12 independent [Propioniciclava sp. MC1595]|uniref:methionine synthase vitamin-B12 independent n=1 Tax=Propioniciclava sp. MC1595 TaxID=2760308 RepID=UPI0016621E58|nr:methionine synthase vitamin-B12 independent [Propioniciclava sp. MC1595]MBB1495320.1 methionine synthase vitamin-B12 independent [Propioniciclava sp. MC1595]NLE18121.1 methionine synthase vitamin-B12 independent [Propioniciclava sp.]QTE24727.1 methionine synthase vitamin-B12 independent [Propioniciclava sp. MC1595]